MAAVHAADMPTRRVPGSSLHQGLLYYSVKFLQCHQCTVILPVNIALKDRVD